MVPSLSVETYQRVAFDGWIIHDPNHPGDANHTTVYTDPDLTLIMDADYVVECDLRYLSRGAGVAMPLLASLGLLALAISTSSRRGCSRPRR
ncbi:MAG: hypothetical protein JXQ73_10245 [Phycisphaerae bacterium]|nr:hypothetical protein [Phycisphaerae bacterium]